MTPLEILLPLLLKVRETGIGRWIACCPAHEDKTPSLSITELGGGKVLLHCFAGCGGAEVVRAVGLELSDLFPPEARSGYERAGRRGLDWNPRDLLAAIRQESLVISCAAGQLDVLSDEELERVQLAGQRIEKALGVANVR